MALSKSEEKMLNIQHQLRENQHELSEFLNDMDSWENEVKQKDEALTKTKAIKELVSIHNFVLQQRYLKYIVIRLVVISQSQKVRDKFKKKRKKGS